MSDTETPEDRSADSELSVRMNGGLVHRPANGAQLGVQGRLAYDAHRQQVAVAEQGPGPASIQ